MADQGQVLGRILHERHPGGPGRRSRPRAPRHACLFRKKTSDIQVVAEADDGDKALALVETTRPDVLVTDIEMPRSERARSHRTRRSAVPGHKSARSIDS